MCRAKAVAKVAIDLIDQINIIMTLSSFANLEVDQSERFSVLGKIASLWMNSPLHRPWTVNLLARFTLPAIEANQYILIQRDGQPVAYCSWAFLTKRAEFKYITDASHIRAADWTGGDRLWFVDWVAPFSKVDSIHMKNELIDKFPYSLARAIRVKKQKKYARVLEFRGRKLDPVQATALHDQYYSDFLDIAKQENMNLEYRA